MIFNKKEKIFSSSRRWLLALCVLMMLSSLWACRNVSTESNLSTLSPQELSLAFAKSTLVEGNRSAALRFISSEMEISLDSLLDIAGASVEKAEDLEISSQSAKAPKLCFLIKTKNTKSSLVKEVAIYINIDDSQEKKISNFYAQVKTARGEVIEL